MNESDRYRSELSSVDIPTGRIVASDSKKTNFLEKSISTKTRDSSISVMTQMTGKNTETEVEKEKEGVMLVPKFMSDVPSNEAIDDSEDENENKNEPRTGKPSMKATDQETTVTQTTNQNLLSPFSLVPSPPVMKTAAEPTIHIFPDLELYPFDQYAAIYFQHVKPKLFHSFNLHSLMTFSKRAPIHSLHCMIVEVERTALDIELQIFQYLNMVVSASTNDDSDNDN